MKTPLAHPTFAYILVCVLTVAVYANSLENPFHYDDMHSIVNNGSVRDLGHVPSYFVDAKAFSADPENAMYRPLLLATFALNYAISGYEVWSYHLVSLALHLACVLLLGALGRQLLDDYWASLFAAALFAVHPICSEPVNYISSRSEILASFFFLLGFCAYLQSGLRLRWLWVGLAFAAGLLSKSIIVVFPAVLLVYEMLVNRRWPVADKGLYALLFGIAVSYVLMVWSFLSKAAIGAPVRPYDQQLWTQVKAVVFYLKLLVWPTPLSVDHQFLLSDSFFDPFAASATLFLLSLLWLAFYHRRQHPLPLFALLWFLIALMPASLVPLNVLVNEHRLYLPSAAFALVIAYGGLNLRRKVPPGWLVGCGLVLMGVASWVTFERNKIWQDEYALWGDAAGKAPLMARPFIYLGDAHMRDGRVAEAVAAFVHVVRRDPGYTPAYVKLGKLYQSQSRDALAADILEKGLGVDRADPEIWAGLAELYRRRQDWQQSLDAYERAVALAPEDAGLRNNLGNTYQVFGRGEDGLAQHQKALALVPGDAETLLNLGNAHMMLQQFNQAVSHYRQALAVRENFAGAWFNLGLAYERLAEAEEALRAYDRAAALEPAYREQVSTRRNALVGKR